MMFIQGPRGRVRVSIYSDSMDDDAESENNNTGLAFSGGGIRSAAFSSGVLRRILQKEIQVDYLSCISGGNFTAAAYLDWKYRHGKVDEHKWHHEFFEHMRSRTGYMCDWTNCCKGICDTIMILTAVLFINLIIPIIVWAGLSMPTAYLVDFVFGEILRAGFDCSQVIIEQGSPFSNTSTCRSKYDHHAPGVENHLMLFVVLLVSFLFFYVLKQIVNNKWSQVITFFQLLSGITFGLVFLPWFLQQFTDVIPVWLTILILVLSLFFWCGFPPLRGIASVAVVFYVFAFIIKWRVYRSMCIFVEYKEEYFYTALLAAGVALWASPYLGAFTRSAIYTLVKWRFQYAFFTKDSVGPIGCSGITCSDFFPVLSTICDCSNCCDEKRALTMADIADLKPQYISNIVADYWRRNPNTLPETMIGLCSNKIEIITADPGSDKLNSSLTPRHIKLADAMSTAAMVTRPPATMDEKFEPFRELQLILGLSATNDTNSIPKDEYGCSLNKIAPFILQSFAGAPIVFLAVVWVVNFNINPNLIEGLVMIVFVSYTLIFSGIAMMPTGASKPWFAEPLVRWCHVHLYHVRFLREFLKVNNVGPLPPAVMSLSDLGRLEKYGLLTLFKRRLKKIVVVDGSYIKADADYANYLLRSLQMARELYHCEFTGYNGRDVIGEIQKMYLNHPSGKLPRSYRFLVNYYDKTDTGYEQAGQGEILLLAPRHPKKGFNYPVGREFTWQEYKDDTEMSLDPNHWGNGPVLKGDEVDNLTFCCCECCHTSIGCCQLLSTKMCGGFPSHTTVNQFFTPKLFSTYHREGYRACIEGDIEGFLTSNVEIV